MLSQFQMGGHDLFIRGLVSSHSGNISVRLGDRMIITRRGSMLGHLTENDLVETGIERNDRNTPAASSELVIHRAIYIATQAQAVLHAHPPHAVALSLMEKTIIPVDAEGGYFLEEVPVIGSRVTPFSRELANEIAEAAKSYKVVLVKGHGSFATGQLLEEAYQWTTLLEESCLILWLVKLLGRRGRKNKLAISSLYPGIG